MFLTARRHQDLYVDLKENLPQTFGFQHVGVLFYEEVTDSLYWIEGRDIKNISLKTENMIRLPYNLGMTGHVIKQKQSVLFPRGEYDPRFVAEIDNINSI